MELDHRETLLYTKGDKGKDHKEKRLSACLFFLVPVCAVQSFAMQDTETKANVFAFLHDDEALQESET